MVEEGECVCGGVRGGDMGVRESGGDRGVREWLGAVPPKERGRGGGGEGGV